MSEKRKPSSRPLSPHLQVYRLPMTALMSIAHRATGAGLAIGTILVTAWLLAAASGEYYYNIVHELIRSDIGVAILFLWSGALYYHLCNGVRHMFWDMGFLFAKKDARFSGFVVLLAASILMAVTWACPCLIGVK